MASKQCLCSHCGRETNLFVIIGSYGGEKKLFCMACDPWQFGDGKGITIEPKEEIPVEEEKKTKKTKTKSDGGLYGQEDVR